MKSIFMFRFKVYHGSNKNLKFTTQSMGKYSLGLNMNFKWNLLFEFYFVLHFKHPSGWVDIR